MRRDLNVLTVRAGQSSVMTRIAQNHQVDTAKGSHRCSSDDNRIALSDRRVRIRFTRSSNGNAFGKEVPSPVLDVGA